MIWVVGDPSTGTSLVMGCLLAGGASVKTTSQHDGAQGFPFLEDNEANNDPMRLRQIRDQAVALKVFPGNAIRCLRCAIIPTHAIVTRRPIEDAQSSRAQRFPSRTWMLAIDGVALERAARLLSQAHVSVLEVPMYDLIRKPRKTCELITAHLAPVVGVLDIDAMSAIPDRGLWHHRDAA